MAPDESFSKNIYEGSLRSARSCDSPVNAQRSVALSATRGQRNDRVVVADREVSAILVSQTDCHARQAGISAGPRHQC